MSESAPSRRGFTLLEVAVAVALLAVVYLTLVPLLRWCGVQERQSQQVAVALQETQNVLEQLSARTWSELTAETAANIQLSSTARQTLRNPQLKVAIHDENETPRRKRVNVELAWTDQAGTTVAPVRLCTWVYQP